MVDIAGGNDISLCFIFLDFSYLAFILFQHVVHSHCSCNVWIFFRLPFGANVGDDQLYTELSKQTVVIENRGRVSHPEVAWTVLRLDLGERMLHMAKCDGGESGRELGEWGRVERLGGGGVDRSQSLFHFVIKDSHSQAGSTRGGGECKLWRIWTES